MSILAERRGHLSSSRVTLAVMHCRNVDVLAIRLIDPAGVNLIGNIFQRYDGVVRVDVKQIRPSRCSPWKRVLESSEIMLRGQCDEICSGHLYVYVGIPR